MVVEMETQKWQVETFFESGAGSGLLVNSWIVVSFLGFHPSVGLLGVHIVRKFSSAKEALLGKIEEFMHRFLRNPKLH